MSRSIAGALGIIATGLWLAALAGSGCADGTDSLVGEGGFGGEGGAFGGEGGMGTTTSGNTVTTGNVGGFGGDPMGGFGGEPMGGMGVTTATTTTTTTTTATTATTGGMCAGGLQCGAVCCVDPTGLLDLCCPSQGNCGVDPFGLGLVCECTDGCP